MMPAVFESAFGSITSSPTSNVPAAIELATVTATGAEVLVLPAASRAVAVRVWLPLEANVVSQETT